MKPICVGDVIGDYLVIDIAGSGGMGAVYKIQHVITKRIEAMKLLPPGLSNDPEQVLRFEREIQVQARLHHPNIAALYNAVRDGDSIALVMEFVEGQSLQSMLEAGPLPLDTAMNFASQVLQALAYAHDAGVIHRDVSPANIIITPDLVAKLTDFGLARGATDLRLSTGGVPLGSPWYMSPEQVKGLDAMDVRTDLYAMGAVLHEMLTGKKLFDVEGAFAVMRAHVEVEPLPPSSRNPGIPSGFDGIVKRAVAKDPSMRFQSAGEFLLALQNVGLVAHPVASPRLRRPWHARFHSLRWRNAIFVPLAPAVLAAGFYTIRLSSSPALENPIPRNPQRAASQVRDTDRPAAPVAAQVELEAPIPTGAKEEPPPVARPPVQPSARAMRRAANLEKGSAASISTGASHAPVAALSPAPEPAKSAEASAPATPVLSEGPEPGPLPAVAATPELPQASPESEPAKPANGNRLVRALGKVNPFRKWTRREPPKTPLKKD